MPLRRFLAILLAISLLGSVATGVVVGGVLKSGLAATEGQLCHRLNVHRNADNINSYATWNVNVLFARALAHPPRTTQPQTPEQKHVTVQFLGLLQRAVSAQTWTPLTACGHPGAGHEPVHFGTLNLTTGKIVGGRQPTQADLQVEPGE